MTSSYRQDKQGNIYQDTNGGATEGGTTTLLMGVTVDEGTGIGGDGGITTKIFNETSEIPKFPKNPPEPHELTRQQLKAYRTLIRDNPLDEIGRKN